MLSANIIRATFKALRLFAILTLSNCTFGTLLTDESSGLYSCENVGYHETEIVLRCQHDCHATRGSSSVPDCGTQESPSLWSFFFPSLSAWPLLSPSFAPLTFGLPRWCRLFNPWFLHWSPRQHRSSCASATVWFVEEAGIWFLYGSGRFSGVAWSTQGAHRRHYDLRV